MSNPSPKKDEKKATNGGDGAENGPPGEATPSLRQGPNQEPVSKQRSKKEMREAKLSEALRANLRRRKQ